MLIKPFFSPLIAIRTQWGPTLDNPLLFCRQWPLVACLFRAPFHQAVLHLSPAAVTLTTRYRLPQRRQGVCCFRKKALDWIILSNVKPNCFLEIFYKNLMIFKEIWKQFAERNEKRLLDRGYIIIYVTTIIEFETPDPDWWKFLMVQN